ncbi:hypothetical protein BDN72DRAFT_860697 [Pluteus cervinus]|uniref:Uncharacterized protein n=1 Tax=Pluteus cervinus TaxID=181527 RepID=A0ACD3AI53_9AGAR|nr:hypothetical protein BDN72DRAFT_860697 [Pluteus cervinus]
MSFWGGSGRHYVVILRTAALSSSSGREVEFLSHIIVILEKLVAPDYRLKLFLRGRLALDWIGTGLRNPTSALRRNLQVISICRVIYYPHSPPRVTFPCWEVLYIRFAVLMFGVIFQQHVVDLSQPSNKTFLGVVAMGFIAVRIALLTLPILSCALRGLFLGIELGIHCPQHLPGQLCLYLGLDGAGCSLKEVISAVNDVGPLPRATCLVEVISAVTMSILEKDGCSGVKCHRRPADLSS